MRLLKYLHPKEFQLFIKDLIALRIFVWDLAKNDFKSRYLGSYFGTFWAFAQPLISMMVIWFVFQVGFRAAPVSEFPYFLWFCTGLIPYYYFQESLNSATNSIVEYAYLVKKIQFRVTILPIIKIISSLFIHLFFIGFIFTVFALYGYAPTRYALQIPYYLFAMIAFVLGVSWTTASLAVFMRDVAQIIPIILNLLLWVSPIFWNIDIISERYRLFFKLNPVYYITNGYRNIFLYKQWFWQQPYLTIYFWGMTFLCWAVGTIVFKKLRPHFADVL